MVGYISHMNYALELEPHGYATLYMYYSACACDIMYACTVFAMCAQKNGRSQRKYELKLYSSNDGPFLIIFHELDSRESVVIYMRIR